MANQHCARLGLNRAPGAILPCWMILFCHLALNCSGTVYYVNSVNGSDGNPGTNVSSAWRSMTNAAAKLHAGDTAYIMAGNYRGDVLPAQSGTNGAWITYSNYPGQQWQAVITNASIQILQKSYIKVYGLKIANSPDWGIEVVGPGGNYVIANNYSTNTVNPGIAVWGVDTYDYSPVQFGYKAVTNVVVANNLIEQACNGGYNEQLDIGIGVDNFVVSNNIIRNATNSVLGGEGIDCKDGVSNGRIVGNELYGLLRTAIYLEAGAAPTNIYSEPPLSTNLLVYGNKVHNNITTNGVAGISISSEGFGNINGIWVYNNLVYSNGSDGIDVHHRVITNVWGNYASNIYIFNNTVYANDFVDMWHGGIWISDTNAHNVVVQNNISVSNANTQIYVVTNATLSVNFSNGIPGFANASSNDFHLLSTSPAIDAGMSNGAVMFDYDGNPRPWGAAWDMGAYEYSPTNPVRVASLGAVDVFKKDLEDGSSALGFFNRGRELENVTFNKFVNIGLGGDYQVRDLWQQKDLPFTSRAVNLSIQPHGVVLLKLTPVEKSQDAHGVASLRPSYVEKSKKSD